MSVLNSSYLVRPATRDFLMHGTALDDAAESLPVLFDREALMERCLGNSQLAANLLNKFVALSLRDLNDLQVSLATGAFENLRGVAHRFKGTAASVGSPRLAAIAGEIEVCANEGQGEMLEKLVSELCHVREQFLAATQPV